MSVRPTGGARARLALLIVVFTTLPSVAGSLWYVQPFRDAKQVGIDADRLRHSGRCASLPREIVCATTFQPSVTPDVQEQLSIAPRTRSLLVARRSWTMSDSSKWVAALDSIRRTARGMGGKPLPCDASETGFPIAEAWALGRHELRLYAAATAEGRLPGEHWFIHVQLIPHGVHGCGRNLTRRPTVAEMDSMFGVWVREHLPY